MLQTQVEDSFSFSSAHCNVTHFIEAFAYLTFVNAGPLFKSSSSEVTWLSLLLAHHQARHVTALHTSQFFSQYGNLPLLKLEGPLPRHFGM